MADLAHQISSPSHRKTFPSLNLSWIPQPTASFTDDEAGEK